MTQNQQNGELPKPSIPPPIADLAPGEVNRRVNFVYQNLTEQFDPAIKKLTDSGHQFFKAFIALSTAQKNYADALDKVVLTSEKCHPITQSIGDCLAEVTQLISEMQQHHDEIIAWYGSQLLTPTENNMRNDGVSLKSLWSKYHKGQKNIYKELKKGSKRGMAIESQLSEQLGLIRQQGLEQALFEEKKRYGFILERHCAWLKLYLGFQRRSYEALENSLPKWTDRCPSLEPENLTTAAALSLLDSAIDEGQEEVVEPETNGPFIQANEAGSISLDSLPFQSSKENDDEVPAEVTLISHTKLSDKSSLSASDKSDKQKESSDSEASESGKNSRQSEKEQVNPIETDVIFRSKIEHIKKIERPQSSPSTTTIPKVKAIHDYQPKEGQQNQLGFKIGDILQVLKSGQMGWCFGMNENDQSRGWYPAGFTEPFL